MWQDRTRGACSRPASIALRRAPLHDLTSQASHGRIHHALHILIHYEGLLCVTHPESSSSGNVAGCAGCDVSRLRCELSPLLKIARSWRMAALCSLRQFSTIGEARPRGARGCAVLLHSADFAAAHAAAGAAEAKLRRSGALGQGGTGACHSAAVAACSRLVAHNNLHNDTVAGCSSVQLEFCSEVLWP